MSCDNGEKRNAACAVKSGVSGVASKSAAVARKVGNAYVNQGKKSASAIAGAAQGAGEFYKDQVGQRVETAKNVGGKAAGVYAGQVKKNVGAYKGAGQAVAGAAKGVGQAYVGAVRRNPIAGAARSLGGFYKSRFGKNYRTAAAAPGAVKSFLGDVRRAKEEFYAPLQDLEHEMLDAEDAFIRGARKTEIGRTGAAKVAIESARGAVAGAMVQGVINYTREAAAYGDRAYLSPLGRFGVITSGASAGTLSALNALNDEQKNAYIGTPEGEKAKARLDAAEKSFDEAEEAGRVKYKASVMASARQLAGNLKAARMAS